MLKKTQTITESDRPPCQPSYPTPSQWSVTIHYDAALDRLDGVIIRELELHPILDDWTGLRAAKLKALHDLFLRQGKCPRVDEARRVLRLTINLEKRISELTDLYFSTGTLDHDALSYLTDDIVCVTKQLEAVLECARFLWSRWNVEASQSVGGAR
jgi:hypothetical protein